MKNHSKQRSLQPITVSRRLLDNPLSFRQHACILCTTTPQLPFVFSSQINQFSTLVTFPSGVFAITLNTSKRTCSQYRLGHTLNLNRLGNTHIGSGHGRKLRVRIIRRGNLDNIGRDDMQAVQASQDRAQLSRRPSASLGCACSGRERRVDRIDLRN
jgi:hypothetical protein